MGRSDTGGARGWQWSAMPRQEKLSLEWLGNVPGDRAIAWECVNPIRLQTVGVLLPGKRRQDSTQALCAWEVGGGREAIGTARRRRPYHRIGGWVTGRREQRWAVAPSWWLERTEGGRR